MRDVLEALSEPLRGYLARYTGNAVLAEDLLQETLLRIERGLAGFDGRAKLETWAYSIATHVAADHFRAPANRLRILDVDETPELPDAAPSVEERLVIDEMNACVREVVESLPGDYRAALVLHDLEGRTAEDVAEICGCTLATAKIRIHRARARLQAALRRECDFYRDCDSVLRCDRKA